MLFQSWSSLFKLFLIYLICPLCSWDWLLHVRRKNLSICSNEVWILGLYILTRIFFIMGIIWQTSKTMTICGHLSLFTCTGSHLCIWWICFVFNVAWCTWIWLYVLGSQQQFSNADASHSLRTFHKTFNWIVQSHVIPQQLLVQPHQKLHFKPFLMTQ